MKYEDGNGNDIHYLLSNDITLILAVLHKVRKKERATDEDDIEDIVLRF